MYPAVSAALLMKPVPPLFNHMLHAKDLFPTKKTWRPTA